nr:histone-lysine N-methyltransferase SETMAR-like isoform X2 [Anolis sagrei ordinatus]
MRENKMADSKVILTANESREVIKFLFLQGKSAKDIHGDMLQTLGDQCPSYSTVKNWVAKFKTGHVSTNDEKRPGRPRVVVVPEIVDAVHNLILENRLISAKGIADIMGISRERVCVIIHEHLNMKKLSAMWVPKCLTTDQKNMRVKTSRSICQRFWTDENFLDQLVTMDETWIYLYDPETKEQSKEWRHSGSPRPKKFRVQKSVTKVMVSVFWDKEGVLLVDYLQNGSTINARYYIELLDQLKAALQAKRRGKLSKGILFLQDNASAHTAQETMAKLVELGFQLVDHPPDSPDLAPSDYHLFPNLKKHIQGTKFHIISDAMAATDDWFEAQPKSFFLQGLQNLEYRCVQMV